MNIRMQTDAWINHIAGVLGFILAASIATIVVLTFMKLPMPDFLVALALVTGAGLAKLLISPLTLGL